MMQCEVARGRLTRIDDPRPETIRDADLAAHLSSCRECQALAMDLAGLENSVRRVPMPAEALQSRAAFLHQIGRSVPTPSVRSRSRRSLRDWVIAFCIVLAVGATTFLLLPRNVDAKPEVMTAVLDWNLRVSEAPDAATRARLVNEDLPHLRRIAERAHLDSPDTQLVNAIIEHGVWLNTNPDPLDEVDRFQRLADQILDRMDSTAKASESRNTELLAKLYVEVRDRGIEGSMERAEQKTPATESATKRLHAMKKALKRHAARADKLAEQMPTAAREHLKHNGKRKNRTG